MKKKLALVLFTLVLLSACTHKKSPTIPTINSTKEALTEQSTTKEQSIEQSTTNEQSTEQSTTNEQSTEQSAMSHEEKPVVKSLRSEIEKTRNISFRGTQFVDSNGRIVYVGKMLGVIEMQKHTLMKVFENKRSGLTIDGDYVSNILSYEQLLEEHPNKEEWSDAIFVEIQKQKLFADEKFFNNLMEMYALPYAEDPITCVKKNGEAYCYKGGEIFRQKALDGCSILLNHSFGITADGKIKALDFGVFRPAVYKKIQKLSGVMDIKFGNNSGSYDEKIRHFVCLKENGTLETTDDEQAYQTKDWTDIIQFEIYGNTTFSIEGIVALKKDGTILNSYTKNDTHLMDEISGWTGIVAIYSDGLHMYGLKENETIVIANLFSTEDNAQYISIKEQIDGYNLTKTSSKN